MGWDAFSSEYRLGSEGKLIHPVFNRMSTRIVHLYGKVDGSLCHGGLDYSASGDMLLQATGASIYEKEGWSVEKVRELRDSANWEFPVNADELWLKFSAKAFLDVSADLGLSITFSW